MFPQLAQYTDPSLLLLRLMIAIVFVTSGWHHVIDPKGRAKSIGLSPGLTMFVGAAELAGGWESRLVCSRNSRRLV
jgi:putative oxidoreductase